MGGFGNCIGLAIGAAGEAADFGRRRVDHVVIDARRNLAGVCGRCIQLSWRCIASSLPSLGLRSIWMMVLVWCCWSPRLVCRWSPQEAKVGSCCA